MDKDNKTSPEDWLASLKIPKNLATNEYEYSGDRQALSVFRALAGADWLCKKFLNFMLTFDMGQLLGGAVKIGDRQFPHIHRLVEKASEILGVATPPVYLLESPAVNSWTFGTDEKKVYIVATRGLVEAIPERGLMFVMGHEIGHIASQHALYHTLASYLGKTGVWATSTVRVPFVSELLGMLAYPLQLSLNAWSRRSEITADRAGLICCQDLGWAQKGASVLALGSKELAEQIDVTELESQADELKQDYGRWTELLSSHPYLPKRLRAIRLFAKSHTYLRHVLQDTCDGFYTMEDLDQSVSRVLGDKTFAETIEIMESTDLTALVVLVAFAAAWQDGNLSKEEKDEIVSLIKKLGLDSNSDLFGHFEKAPEPKLVDQRLRYFKGNKLVALPYAFSFAMMDRKKIAWTQTAFLEKIALLCGLSKDESRKIVRDASFRFELLRDRCEVNLCSNCCQLSNSDSTSCPNCGVDSLSLVRLVPNEKKLLCPTCRVIFNQSDFLFCPKCKSNNVVVPLEATAVK